jgi:hypothetical protein
MAFGYTGDWFIWDKIYTELVLIGWKLYWQWITNNGLLMHLTFCDCCLVGRQRPRKHFESGGALTKRGTFVYDQNQRILWRSRAERKFLKIWSLYNVGNGLYRVFTTAKRAFSFQNKRAFIQEILFSFFNLNVAFQPRKKGTFFTFKKSGGGTCPHCPPPPPRFRGPCW